MIIDSNELHKLSLVELKSLYEDVVRVYRFKQSQVQVDTARQFRVGDSVVVNAKTRGQIEGTITKINLKTILVDCGLRGQFKCSPSLLTLSTKNDKVSVGI